MNKKFTKLLSFVLMLIMVLGAIPSSDTKAAAKSTKIRLVVDGIASSCKATKKNGDWYVNVKDVKKALGIDKPAGKKSGKVSLNKVAKKADISYECDMVLDAAYFWNEIPYGDSDYVRAFDLGLVSDEYKKNRDKNITSTEFRELLTKLIKTIDKKKVSSFNDNVTTYKKKLLGGEAVGMAYYAARAIGADNILFWGIDSAAMIEKGEGSDAFWSDSEFAFDKLFPNFYKGEVTLPGENVKWDNDRIASYMWLFYHQSDYSGELMIPFDYDNYSFYLKDPFTWEQAIAVITRLYDSSSKTNASKIVKINSTEAVTPDKRILSPGLIEKVNSENNSNKVPEPLTGMSLTNQSDISVFPASPEELKMISQWGFNTVRILLRFDYFFDDDVTRVDVNKLKKLDEIVAAAIKYRLHLNIGFESLPGRYYKYVDEVTRTGSFDMFINDKHLKQAGKVWEIISTRYSGIPNGYLSFTPLWEAMNPDLSTGIGAPDYTWEDVREATLALIDSIRKADPNRYIIFEPTSTNTIDGIFYQDHADSIYSAVTDKFENVTVMTNYAEWAYVYQEMTATEGRDIDLYTHGMYKQNYPVYIYAAAKQLGEDYPVMNIGGFLPEGTILEIYLNSSRNDTELTIKADGKKLYSEKLPEKEYNLTTEYLSKFYLYAESEKKIEVKLGSKTELLSLEASGYLEMCGINIILPEKYAVEKLYYPSKADYLQGGVEKNYVHYRPTSTVMICPNTFDGKSGYNININKDVSFTSDSIFMKADKETVTEFFKEYNKFFTDAIMRFEEASFNIGTTQDSKLSYYDNFLSSCKKYGYGWISTDYYDMFSEIYENPENGSYMLSRFDVRGLEAMGMEFTEYKGKYLEIPLLKCLQKYQSKARVR